MAMHYPRPRRAKGCRVTVFYLYECPPCRTRWWTRDQEISEGHHCRLGYPEGGMIVARVEQPDPDDRPLLKVA
jgi:hypothetical protein